MVASVGVKLKQEQGSELEMKQGLAVQAMVPVRRQ